MERTPQLEIVIRIAIRNSVSKGNILHTYEATAFREGKKQGSRYFPENFR